MLYLVAALRWQLPILHEFSGSILFDARVGGLPSTSDLLGTCSRLVAGLVAPVPAVF